MAKATKKTTKGTEKTTGAKWAIKTLRTIVKAQLDSGTKSFEDVACVEFEIAKYKQRKETNRLLAQIAKRLKKG